MASNLARALWASAFAVGCASSGQQPSDAGLGTGDVGRDGDAASDGPGFDGGDAGACHDVESTAPIVKVEDVPGSPPTPTGGVISPGKYHLVSSKRYGKSSTGATSFSHTVVIEGDQMRIAERSDGSTSIDRRTLRFLTMGTRVTLATKCGGTEGAIDDFTATEKSYVLLLSLSGGITFEQLYLKQ